MIQSAVQARNLERRDYVKAQGEIIKTIDLRVGPSGRSGERARICSLRGCAQTTREGKPYCPDHVDCNPYVQEILQTLEERENKRERVKKKGAEAVDVHGLDAQEILTHLKLHGGRTIERLVRELQIEAKLLRKIVPELAKNKLVKMGKTKRGATTANFIRFPEP